MDTKKSGPNQRFYNKNSIDNTSYMVQCEKYIRVCIRQW